RAWTGWRPSSGVCPEGWRSYGGCCRAGWGGQPRCGGRGGGPTGGARGGGGGWGRKGGGAPGQGGTGAGRDCRTTARPRQKAKDPVVAEQLRHLVRVTRSYWSGLFHCYTSADLPRTNNDLEHLFGSHRYHERRASGRKQGSPGLVVQGSVRVVASLATRLRPEEGLKLRTGYVEDWGRLRAELDKRRESRRQQRRFRRDPTDYLSRLEDRCLRLSLPT